MRRGEHEVQRVPVQVHVPVQVQVPVPTAFGTGTEVQLVRGAVKHFAVVRILVMLKVPGYT